MSCEWMRGLRGRVAAPVREEVAQTSEPPLEMDCGVVRPRAQPRDARRSAIHCTTATEIAHSSRTCIKPPLPNNTPTNQTINNASAINQIINSQSPSPPQRVSTIRIIPAYS